MMFKLVFARAINSAFLLFIITSDTEQFQADTLSKVALVILFISPANSLVPTTRTKWRATTLPAVLHK